MTIDANGPYLFDGEAHIRMKLESDMSRPAFGPKAADHPTVGLPCAACTGKFEVGDYTTLIPLGPGSDEEAQMRAYAGGFFNSVAVEVHWSCATGQDVLELIDESLEDDASAAQLASASEEEAGEEPGAVMMELYGRPGKGKTYLVHPDDVVDLPRSPRFSDVVLDPGALWSVADVAVALRAAGHEKGAVDFLLEIEELTSYTPPPDVYTPLARSIAERYVRFA